MCVERVVAQNPVLEVTARVRRRLLAAVEASACVTYGGVGALNGSAAPHEHSARRQRRLARHRLQFPAPSQTLTHTVVTLTGTRTETRELNRRLVTLPLADDFH